jgi:hypothetical protein
MRGPQLELALHGLGADGVVVSAMTLRAHGDACRTHPGGTDHVAEAVITGIATRRSGTSPPPSLAVLSVNNRRHPRTAQASQGSLGDQRRAVRGRASACGDRADRQEEISALPVGVSAARTTMRV